MKKRIERIQVVNFKTAQLHTYNTAWLHTNQLADMAQNNQLTAVIAITLTLQLTSNYNFTTYQGPEHKIEYIIPSPFSPIVSLQTATLL